MKDHIVDVYLFRDLAVAHAEVLHDTLDRVSTLERQCNMLKIALMGLLECPAIKGVPLGEEDQRAVNRARRFLRNVIDTGMLGDDEDEEEGL